MGNEIVQTPLSVSDKHAHPLAPKQAPAMTYDVTPSEFRQAQNNQATALAESNTFLFHDLNLPQNKDLLATIKELSAAMGKTPDKPGMTALADGSQLMLGKDGGQVTVAGIIRRDGSEDAASFDSNFKIKSETISSPLGNRTRQYRADGTLASEENSVPGPGGKPSFQEKLEFDKKGKDLIASHEESATDVIDDKRMPDGSGLYTQTHKDADPKQAYTIKVVTNTNGSGIEDKKFGNGDWIHVETSADGTITKKETSDIEKGLVHRQERQPDGEMKETQEIII